jgi:6,7-dimethyl-8-ribityllumazine synthase
MSDRNDAQPDPSSAAERPELVADEPESELEHARENVFDGWPALTATPADEEAATDAAVGADEAPVAEDSGEPHAVEPFAAETEREQPTTPEPTTPEAASEPAPEHAPGELAVPPGYSVLEGAPNGSRRSVGVVVARFNGDVTTRLLDSALGELERAGVVRDAITVMPVPGAFELPLAAMALAKTRRFAAIVALGCVIRGDTPHFDYIASEAASGLQLAALETGVPVAFGVLTLDDASQVDDRVGKGAEAVRTALEMADVFANLRAAAAA